jgi:hypothetical protein
MSTITTKRVWPGLVALCIAAVAALLAVASPAKAAGFFPTGDVDGVSSNGVIYYPFQPAIISGWAADADAPKSPILVRADFTWSKRGPCNALTCVTYVVGQSSLTQWANLYRSDLLGEAGPNDVLWGPNHGFSFTNPAPPAPIGTYDEKVCLTAFNAGPGANRSLGCYPLVFFPIF